MAHIVIIGNGISGITCARHVRKISDDEITVISAESEHFFSRTALMYIYMGHMKYEHTKPYEDFFWDKNKIKLLKQKVTAIDAVKQTITTENKTTISFDKLVIATGSLTAMYDWPGSDLKNVCGLYSLQDLEMIEHHTKDIQSAVIVGGGLIGVELAEMLHVRHIDVTILVKDDYYWGNVLPTKDALLVEAQLKNNGIKVLKKVELDKINGTHGKAKSVTTKDGREINCQFVGITTGVKPNISFIKNSGVKTDKGILVNKYFETGSKNIYAIGDCAQFEKPLPGRKPIEQVWYTGKMHGETLAQTLCGNRTAYQPGPWYNSAKFFDLEYQTYGLVPAMLEDKQAYFFWKHPKDDAAIGICYNKNDKTLAGINSYGIRLRHAFFDKCLKENKNVAYILSHLQFAWFNSEFSKNYIPEILQAWNNETGEKVKKINKLATAFHL